MGKQRLGMGGKPETDIDDQKKTRLDLSVPQVAGSALAAVAAAVLASTLGVYGTMIGAGVVSVVATCGGTIFQHLFRRTGEQIREVTVQVKPKGRQVPVRDPHDPHDGRDPHDPRAFDDATRVMRTVGLPRDIGGAPDRTQLLWKADLPDETAEEFTDGTTHGTRVRGWKRSVIAAVVVFVVAMGGITTYELISGGDLSGGKGTTFSNVVQGGEQKKDAPSDVPSDTPDTGSPSPGTGSDGEPTPDKSAGTGGDSSPDPTPTASGSGGDPSKPATPTPTPTPSGSTDGDTGGDTGDTSDSDKGTGSTADSGSERDAQNDATPAP
ncbi:hypothetical protein ABCR94_17985 [Streptomyces sp. 21So2-11]|uniref:hypothetical protein n=1 Tax=Streptomyces sp. 21So2-11 TaxID=3144408 RepID=UPI00321B63E4